MRIISNRELADLPEEWENPTVDTIKYFQCVMSAYECTEIQYNAFKKRGRLVQYYKEKYYVER